MPAVEASGSPVVGALVLAVVPLEAQLRCIGVSVGALVGSVASLGSCLVVVGLC